MDEIARIVEIPVSRWYLCIFPGDIGSRGESRVGREERRSERLSSPRTVTYSSAFYGTRADWMSYTNSPRLGAGKYTIINIYKHAYFDVRSILSVHNSTLQAQRF